MEKKKRETFISRCQKIIAISDFIWKAFNSPQVMFQGPSVNRLL